MNNDMGNVMDKLVPLYHSIKSWKLEPDHLKVLYIFYTALKPEFRTKATISRVGDCIIRCNGQDVIILDRTQLIDKMKAFLYEKHYQKLSNVSGIKHPSRCCTLNRLARKLLHEQARDDGRKQDFENAMYFSAFLSEEETVCYYNSVMNQHDHDKTLDDVMNSANNQKLLEFITGGRGIVGKKWRLTIHDNYYIVYQMKFVVRREIIQENPSDRMLHKYVELYTRINKDTPVTAETLTFVKTVCEFVPASCITKVDKGVIQMSDGGYVVGVTQKDMLSHLYSVGYRIFRSLTDKDLKSMKPMGDDGVDLTIFVKLVDVTDDLGEKYEINLEEEDDREISSIKKKTLKEEEFCRLLSETDIVAFLAWSLDMTSTDCPDDIYDFMTNNLFLRQRQAFFEEINATMSWGLFVNRKHQYLAFCTSMILCNTPSGWEKF